ncbi:MAG: alpha/beta fold hydrolase [Acidobacteriota bacterium]
MHQQPVKDPWIAFHKARPNARMRLFCLPFAGGGAITYRDWPNEMPAEVEVMPIQLPGRERRLREAAYTRMEPLVDALDAALAPYLDKPFAIFGHSMGAAIGHEWTRRLKQAHGLAPVSLLVSARRAPHISSEDKYYLLPDGEFREHLREMNGTPGEVLANPELMELLLPLLRADFELNDTHEPALQPLLDCPVSVYGGLEDAEISRSDLTAWEDTTTGSYRLRMFEGDHFFLNAGRAAVLEAVVEDLLG